jgi:hypothetical protein
MSDPFTALVAPIALALTCQAAQPIQTAAPGVSRGIIRGVVVDERQNPVSRVQVQAFPARTPDSQMKDRSTVPFSTRAGGTATTDAEGRFQISGLEFGQYLVAVDPTLSTTALIEQFKREKYFWRQFTIGQEIVKRHDLAALSSLADWLGREDRHVRGNVAFIFARLGDPRGFEVIREILTDRSDRPEGQGIPGVAGDGKYHVAAQIATDRYYAAHLLGDLRDPRGVTLLVPLLKDKEVESIVPWALGEIGDKRAVPDLIAALDDESPSTRVLVIYALETLRAREALPRLTALLDDHRTSNFGAQVSVADAARAAIAKLR